MKIKRLLWMLIFTLLMTRDSSAFSISGESKIPEAGELEEIVNASEEMRDYLIKTDKEQRIKAKNFTVNISTFLPVTSLSGKTKYLLFIATRTTEEENPIQSIAGVYLKGPGVVKILASGFAHNLNVRKFLVNKNTDYVLVEGVCGGNCSWEADASLFEFDEQKMTFENKFKLPFFHHMSADGCDGSSNYIDKAELKGGDWLDNGLREIIAEITRDDMGSEPPEKIKKIVEHYS
jgi:hypothetical protein